MGVVALVLGVFGAVRLQRDENVAAPAIAARQVEQPAPVGAPLAAPPAVAAATENPPTTQAVVSRESSPPALAPVAELPAPSAAPVPAATVAPAAAPTAAPSAAPASVAAATPAPPVAPQPAVAPQPVAPAQAAPAGPHYWIEFGAYDPDHPIFADRLKAKLERLGIQATITTTTGPRGRQYLRVRSIDETGRSEALAQWSKAHKALHVRPLLHRVTTDHLAAAQPANDQPSDDGGFAQSGNSGGQAPAFNGMSAAPGAFQLAQATAPPGAWA
jgi:hypothetical protein